jgi:GT2 family glycosyltransferase
MSSKNITIVSLAWNEYDMTEVFLGRLKKYTDIPYNLVFTDNGSKEPIVDLVLETHPSAIVIGNKKNVGCPATRNKAMKHAATEITFWLDNDCMVGPGWYKPALEKLKDPTIGITANTSNYIVKNPWSQPYPFERVERGDVDWFMGWLVGFKTKAYKPINDYSIPVNLDDVELAWGIKSNGYRAVVSDIPFAKHEVSKTKRGWEFNDQEKLTELWANWPDKSIFEQWK